MDSGRMVLRHVDRELKAEFDISADDVTILEAISNAGRDGIRMSNLAHRLASEPRHATYRVERLARKGLVRRAAGTHDKRVVRVIATDETGDFLASCRARLEELMAIYLTDLVPAAERRTLLDLLDGVVAGYRHHIDIDQSPAIT